MAQTATLARPYANAAFDVAKAHGRLAEWSRMLALLAAAVATAEVEALIGDPSLGGEVKAHKLAQALQGELDDRGRRFVLALALYQRLALLPEVARQFEVMKAAAENVLEVEIVAAVALAEPQRERFAQALARRFGQEVQLAVTVDETILGGAIVRAGDTVIDGSVRGRLMRLAASLRRG